MKRLSLVLVITFFILPLVTNTPAIIIIPDTDSAVNFEPALFSEGSLMNITVSEDVCVINGSFAGENQNGLEDLYIGTANGGGDNWFVGRSWFKFNLSHVDLPFYRAVLRVYVDHEWAAGLDEPIGAYYCSDDTWIDSILTWNNQPAFSSEPSDVIDSPASPNMFIGGNWYDWEITNDVRLALAGDKILTEVLKQTAEIGTQDAMDFLARLSFNPEHAANIELFFTNPMVSNLTTDGYSEIPMIDYIQNPNPTLNWDFSDLDIGDYQRGYNVEFSDDEHFSGPQLWNSTSESVINIYNSSSVTGHNHPFGLDNEVRLQIKYPSILLPRSGIVDKLYFRTLEETGTLKLENFEISMLMVEDSSMLSPTFNVNYNGSRPTRVLAMDSYEISYSDHTLVIDFENSFMLNNYLNLIIELRLMGNKANLTRVIHAGTNPGSVACATGAGSYTTNIADYAVNRTYDLRIGFQTVEVFASDLANASAFPFGVTLDTSGLFQIKYNQSSIGRAGVIDSVYFRVEQLNENVVFENLTVSVVETPVKGALSHLDFSSNYGGRTPIIVIDANSYVVRNLGRCLILDFQNVFYYSNAYDLLLELSWDSISSGYATVPNPDSIAGCYRAWDVHWLGSQTQGNSTAGYNFMIDFIDSDTSVHYDGPPLINNTYYYWRVQTCDSYGFWSDWTTQSFRYTPLTSGPYNAGPLISPVPAYVGDEVRVSIHAYYFLGMGSVNFELDGSNFTMTENGTNHYIYTWTPNEAGTYNYTIFMKSAIGTYSTVSGTIEVFSHDISETLATILVTIGVIALVLVVVGVVRFRRGKSMS